MARKSESGSVPYTVPEMLQSFFFLDSADLLVVLQRYVNPRNGPCYALTLQHNGFYYREKVCVTLHPAETGSLGEELHGEQGEHTTIVAMIGNTLTMKRQSLILTSRSLPLFVTGRAEAILQACSHKDDYLLRLSLACYLISAYIQPSGSGIILPFSL